MANNISRRINIWINGKEVQGSLQEIRAGFMKARAEVSKTTRGTKEYQQKLAEFKKYKKALDDHRQDLYGVRSSWLSVKNIIAGVVGGSLLTAGLSKFKSFAVGLVKDNARLSDSFADVRKTTGLALEEVSDLYDEFKAFNTRTPRSELLALAQEAGRLGIKGKENIKSFVEQSNQIRVALGEDLGEDAVLQIGKLSDAFNGSMLQIGSAINELGANSKAQEQYLVDFAGRTQGLANVAELSAADILGFGAVLDGLGQKAEMSGTALNTFFIDFIKDSEKFGKVAGFANGELSKLIGEKGANEGFLTFIERLKESSTSSEDFLKKLEAVGVNGARGSQVFLALSGNLDQVRKMQNLANDAFDKGTSLTNEYNIKNENLAANLEKIGNYLSEAFTSGSIMNGLNNVVGLFKDWVEVPLSETLEEERIQLNVMEMELNSANLTSEDRIKLIQKMKSEYPEYLGHIDEETISNKELSEEIDQVNKLYIKKIALQSQSEDLEGEMKLSGKAIGNQLAARRAIMEKLVEVEEKYGIQISDNLTLAEQVEDAKSKMAASNQGSSMTDLLFGSDSDELDNQLRVFETLSSVSKESEARMADLKLQMAETEAQLNQMLGIASGTETSPSSSGEKEKKLTSGGGLSDEEKKKLEKKRQEFLKAEAQMQRDLEDLRIQNIQDEEERDLKKAELDYQRRQKEIDDSVASEKIKNQVLIEEKEAFENKVDEIRLKYQEKRDQEKLEREEVEREIKAAEDEQFLVEMDLEIAATEAKYDRLFELAKKHGIDSAKLEEAREKEISEIKEHYAKEGREKKLAEDLKMIEDAHYLSSAMIGTISSMMQFIGNSSEGMNEFQKSMALFQIGTDLAVGIMRSAKMATNAPDPITAGAIYASMAGMVFNAFNRSTQLVGSQKSPSFRSAPRHRKGRHPGILSGPSHDSDYGGMPIIDPSTGQVVGVMEGNEPILSAETYRNNKPIVDELLNSSLYGGGRSIDFGFLSAQNQPSLNFKRAGSAIRGDNYQGVGSAGQSGSDLTSTLESMQLFREVLNEVRELKQNPAPIYLSKLKQAEKDLEDVQKLSGLKRN